MLFRSFAQQNYGENLKRSGAQVPGVTKGVATQRYLTRVLRRITLPGALLLGIVAVMPFLVGVFFPFTGGGQAGLLLMLGASAVGALSTAFAIRTGNRTGLRQSPVYAWLILAGALVAVIAMQRALGVPVALLTSPSPPTIVGFGVLKPETTRMQAGSMATRGIQAKSAGGLQTTICAALP